MAKENWGWGKEQLESEERRMIETDSAKGKVALEKGRSWNRKRENLVIKRIVG
jgi:hypothetical protein